MVVMSCLGAIAAIWRHIGWGKCSGFHDGVGMRWQRCFPGDNAGPLGGLRGGLRAVRGNTWKALFGVVFGSIVG